MGEKNARLLRRHIRVMGPDRMPEMTAVKHGDRTFSMKNPIIESCRDVFRNGTAEEKARLARHLRIPMDPDARDPDIVGWQGCPPQLLLTRRATRARRSA